MTTTAPQRRATARRAGSLRAKPGARQILPPTLLTRLGRRQVRSLGRSRAKVNLWHGSIRAGKTLVSWIRFLAAIAEWDGDGAIVIIGRTRDTVYQNLFEPIERGDRSVAWCRPFVKYRQGATQARILGKRVTVLGANDAGAAAKVRGMTVGLAYCDEVSVWAESMFTELLGRMSPPGAALFATTNPDNPGHWLHRWITQWEEGLQPDWAVFHFTMEDNPGLTAEYRRFIEKQYAGLWYKRMILGLWVAAQGAIYADWSLERHTVAWDQLPPLQRLLCVAVDFGVNHATSMVLLGVTDERDPLTGRPTPRLIAVDEWRHDSSGEGQRLAPSAQVRKMAAWLSSPHTPAGVLGTVDELEPEYLFRDPAAAELGEEWYDQQGEYLYLADNDVLPGIADVANLLHTDRLVIARPTTDGGHGCPGVIQEAPGYVWATRANGGQLEKDEPRKEADDSMDALRYAIRSTKIHWGPILQSAYGIVA